MTSAASESGERAKTKVTTPHYRHSQHVDWVSPAKTERRRLTEIFLAAGFIVCS